MINSENGTIWYDLIDNELVIYPIGTYEISVEDSDGNKYDMIYIGKL